MLLASLEISWVLVRARALFLSLGERLLYALASSTGLASCVLLMGLALWACSRAVPPLVPTLARRRAFVVVVRSVWCLAWAALGGALFWSLSDGRRVRDLTVRPYAVVLLALLVGLVAWLALRGLERLQTRASTRVRWLAAAACLAFAGNALLDDALILPRGYPAFHRGLGVLAVLLAAFAGLAAPRVLAARLASVRAQRGVALAALLVLLLAPWSLSRLASHPTAGFAVRETAPWSGKLAALLAPKRTRAPASSSTAAAITPIVSDQMGVDLRDRDVLLITVDALRADMLRAYGGSGRTPELDQLAEQSAVFMRAYTPAPHTSYALASLLTGKFVKPLVELGEKLGDPPTLPDRLRRYGYRTAAFYPPAIFFVDGASFEPLQKRGFGFEYRKEMFASAPERVAQLSDYLSQADAKKPVFAWVHLFEPHEPYAPPAGSVHDGSERGRYEAEVAVCDSAIAALVRAFREARPRATVIVTADHGEEFGDHGGSFHGTSLYDEQVRVPLLWSSPGAVSPRRIDVPVELTDLGTTILSTAAIPRDAHMRGDELGAVLAGHAEQGPRFAFASIDARHMITDGRRKLICSASELHCALFDLHADRAELHNLAAEQPDTVRQMRGELDSFLSSISRTEAVTVSAGVRLPEALARAKLGGSSSADELVALLSDARAAVRLEAARALGEQSPASQPAASEPAGSPALAALTRARLHDSDPLVRGEAAIAALQRGDLSAVVDVLAVLRGEAASSPDAGTRARASMARARRAALALAGAEEQEAVPVLAGLVEDESATESERLRAVRTLGTLRSPLASTPLARALRYVRLREAAAFAL